MVFKKPSAEKLEVETGPELVVRNVARLTNIDTVLGKVTFWCSQLGPKAGV